MQLDADTCYRALRSRDRRFEGRFYVGIVTTGVYCRPGCPAPPARRENMRFFACAAAAEADGFRACFRCRPDAAPGTPAWVGTSATVSRALRLIGEGALDADGDAESLASRLGVGTRHLRRLFAQHLGASPTAVAQTRRLHFARKLLEETDLPIAHVAMSAGFGSVRRFNAAMRATFDRTPRELRGAAPADAGELVLRLPYREPFDWDGLLAFLAPRAIPGIEEIRDGTYRRGDIEVTRGDGFLRLHLRRPPAMGLIDLVERVRRLFDMRADPHAIAAHLGRDPLLAKKLAAHPGVRVPGAWDPFEMAVRAVLGQQISVARATALAGKLATTFGLSPAALADADIARIGMPGARAETIRQLARAMPVLDGSRPLEETVAQLKAIPGIGDWTAQYIAMRAIGEPDAFPAGDLGLRKALPGQDVTARAETWRPWRAYAAMLLWRNP